MKNKITFLMILLSAISNVSACSFKASTENNQIAANSTKVEENSAAVKKIAANDSDVSAVTQTGGKTGTYNYKKDGAVNEISIQELAGNKLRVEVYASFEYKINGNMNANVGEAKGIAALDGDRAVFVPEDREDCKIVLKFSGGKIIVKQVSQSNCGFGLNAYAGGTYRKVNNKPDFADSDEDSASGANSKTSEQVLKPERIRFERGKSSILISGKTIGREEKIYLLGARSGQTITIKITEGARNDDGGSNDTVFYLIAPDGSYPMGMADETAELETSWSGKLSKTGDYKIVVGAIESENVNFKMSVAIR